MTPDDMTLVREFAARQSETAFAALVERHVSLVHSAALRRSGDAHLAEEITQAVFIILARKAASLGPNTILPAWLYRTTRYAADNALTIQRRRRAREQEAYMQSTLQSDDTTAVWQQLAPLLEDAMDKLSERDRAPLVLRYFENRPWREVAGLMRVKEDAAQKRGLRALEKLRALFAKRGVKLTTAIIAGAVSANSVQAAPAGMAKTISLVTATKSAAASASTLTLVKGALKVMAWQKTTIVAGVCLILILAGGTTAIAFKRHSPDPTLVENAYSRGNLKDPQYQAVLADLRANVWPKERKAAEAKIKARQRKDEATGAVTIDLKPYINAALTDSPASRGKNTENNLAELPKGTHIYGGVRFDVEGLIQLDGTNMQAFKKDYPAEADGIPINQKCSKVYLLHGANWIYGHDFGTTVAKLVLHYADKSTREIEIVAGKHVFDFWSPLFTTGVDRSYLQMADGTERAWTGSNPLVKKIWPDESLVLYRSAFENPQPDVAVSSVDYVSIQTGTAPFLVGLTVE
jgi:RNA polymerase sigma factor (sigma-70 family)